MNKLTTTSLSLVISCASLVGCGGGNPQAEAEKAAVSFNNALAKSDFDKAGKLLYLENGEQSQTWSEIQFAKKALDNGTVEGELKDLLPLIMWLSWDLRPFHSEKADALMSSAFSDEEMKAEMAVNDVQDMRPVLFRAELKPEFTEQWKSSGRDLTPLLVYTLCVKHKGAWKTSIDLVPVPNVNPDTL
jgi:hypothetical protein